MGWFVSGFAEKKTASAVSDRVANWRGARCKLGIPGVLSFGLDAAGNVICSRSYMRQSQFGWSCGTVFVTSDYQDSKNLSAAGTALTGVPIHWKGVLLLAKRARALAEKANSKTRKEAEAASVATAASPADSPEGPPNGEGPKSSSIPFKEITVGEVLNGLSLKQHLRLMRRSSFVTWAYKSFYWASLASAVVLLWYNYICFKLWLNPPARQGLVNIENWLLQHPRAAVRSARSAVESVVSHEAVEDALALARSRLTWYDALVDEIRKQSSSYEAERRAREAAERAEVERRRRQEERAVWGQRAVQAVCVALIALCLL